MPNSKSFFFFLEDLVKFWLKIGNKEPFYFPTIYRLPNESNTHM